MAIGNVLPSGELPGPTFWRAPPELLLGRAVPAQEGCKVKPTEASAVKMLPATLVDPLPHPRVVTRSRLKDMDGMTL